MPNESNKKKVIENFAGDQELVITAYSSFLPMIPDYLEEIRKSLKDKNQKQLLFAIHTFKGAASNFQPVELARIFKQMKVAVESSNFELAQDLFLEMEAEIPLFQDRMSAWVKDLERQISAHLPLHEGGRVLILDDDQFVANLTAAKLKSVGFETHVILTADNILTLIKKETIDLVIVDLFLKNASGLEVLKMLRESFSPFQLPIIILTGSESVHDTVECLKAGANDFLTKPVVLEVTAARIRTQLMIKELYGRALESKEMESINKMIVTYNHEINNPLSIALGFLGRVKKQTKSSDVEKIESSLIRIQNIVQKIAQLDSKSDSTDYLKKSKMYKVS
jgi:CheY-like chemotaxis protein